MSLRYILAALALVPAALATGCGSEDALEEVTDSTQQPLATPDFEMPQNGLNPGAVDVNYSLLSKLWLSPLNSPGLDSILSNNASLRYLFDTREDTSAEKLMDDIVSCALDPTEIVTANVNNVTFIWKGQFGLCGKMSPFGKWSVNGPNQACREVVSGCVLARMNALDRQVPISIRVPNASVFQPSPKVRVQTTLRDRTTIGIGWQPDFVGICKRGEEVTLQRKGATMVRVCKGIHGCDTITSHQNFPGFPPYAGFVQEFTAGSGPITFTCPTDVGAAPSGQSDRTYFSIMVVPPPGGSLPPDPIAASLPGATFTYPATERQVFTYPEGAFYGDIFPGMTDGTGWVCYSELWQAGTAYLADRLCAAPYPSESCSALHGHSSCLMVCGVKSPAPEQVYYNCWDGSVSGERALTVFLNAPHDLSSNPQASAIVCTPHNECTPGAPLPKGCSPVVKSICAVDSYCCNTAWDSICVNEVQSVANNLTCVAGTCGHTLCTTGNKLTSGCDVPPLTSSCVASICKVAPYCCNGAWDSLCVGEVKSVCGKTCT